MILGILDIHPYKNKSKYLLSSLKMSFKWIKDLNIRLETIKLIKEKLGKILQYVDMGKDFLSRIPVTISTNIDKGI